jgi:L-alanine-DL-glutamate epimerase-like enolase superfamily enzyme
MQITRVEPFVVHVPLRLAINDSASHVTHWGVPGLKLHTDSGLFGTGYTGTHAVGDELILGVIRDHYGPRLLGKDPFNVRQIWEDLHLEPLHWIGRLGITTMAHAAIDIALWDLMAKASQRPLWQLLGGHKPDRIATYNTDGGWLNWSEQQLTEDCRRIVAQGWQGVKIKLGKPNPAEDLRRVAAVRRAIGDDVMLMVDVNQKWSLNTALTWGRRLADHNVYWLEEPIHPDDVEGHARLTRELSTPIATGEHIYSSFGFRDLIARQAIDFVQVDATRVAGITEALTIANLAAAHGLPIVPHISDMMQVQQHIVAAFPNAPMLEYMPWLLELFEEPVRVDGGSIVTPNTPGASTTMRADTFAKWRVA